MSKTDSIQDQLGTKVFEVMKSYNKAIYIVLYIFYFITSNFVVIFNYLICLVIFIFGYFQYVNNI